MVSATFLTLISSKLAMKTAAGLLGATLFVGGATYALPAAGFGAAGVKAGTIAAGVQSTIGNVAAGSMFATLQSAGAAGLAIGTKAVLGVGGAVTGTVLSSLGLRDKKEDTEAPK